MLLGRQNLGHHDMVERRRGSGQRLHFKPGHGQSVSQLGNIKRRVNEATQPGFWKLHDNCP